MEERKREREKERKRERERSVKQGRIERPVKQERRQREMEEGEGDAGRVSDRREVEQTDRVSRGREA